MADNRELYRLEGLSTNRCVMDVLGRSRSAGICLISAAT